MNEKMLEISYCEVCGNENLVEVLDLGDHPLCDDLLPIGSKEECVEYPIQILYCSNCYTAHQRFQVDKRSLFTNQYHYRARMTGSVLTGMSDLVENCQRRFGDLRGKKVLDVGCNDGSLLNFFRLKGCRTFGVEPTDAAKDADHQVLQEFFDDSSASKVLNEFGTPDFITFTNVFAHISNLGSLLESLKILIGKQTVLVIENHFLGAILDTGQFDTFYHEHPRTYSRKSFEIIARNLGLALLDDQYVSRYGGNIRAYLGHGDPLRDRSIDESKYLVDFQNLRSDIDIWKISSGKLIQDYNEKYGAIRAKAFPGRAAILIKLLGLTEKNISAVYEIKGSIKIHHYIPGTKIPILPEKDLYELDDQSLPILNLAWHIPGEVRANLTLNGYTGPVIDIKPMNAGD